MEQIDGDGGAGGFDDGFGDAAVFGRVRGGRGDGAAGAGFGYGW